MRMLASADTYFGVKSGASDSFLPDEETLASITIPIEVLVTGQSHAFFAEAAARLAELLGVESHKCRVRTFVSGPSRGARADGQAVPSARQPVTAKRRIGKPA